MTLLVLLAFSAKMTVSPSWLLAADPETSGNIPHAPPKPETKTERQLMTMARPLLGALAMEDPARKA